MVIYEAAGRIKNKDIREGTIKIISKNNYNIQHGPASASGKNHQGETIENHLINTFLFVELHIQELDIDSDTADLLISAALLHDIGNCELLYPGDVYEAEQKGEVILLVGDDWEYYEATGWSRNNAKAAIHPIISSEIIGNNPFAGSDIIQALVLTHMSHWNSEFCPNPNMYKEDLRRLAEILAMSDYLAARSEVKIEQPK